VLGALLERQPASLKNNYATQLIRFYAQQELWQESKRLQLNKTFTKQRPQPSEKATLQRNKIEPKHLDEILKNRCQRK